MEHSTEYCPTFREIEKGLFIFLQQTYGEIMEEILENIESIIAKHQDKKRYQLKDKREVQIDTSFGPIIIKRKHSIV
ncbi:transposase [Bacillus methanolicus PB1]|uniref:Transposase n=1 Tax=Bacillus methanolicus PB1 TaxID=997296 RepID=I3DVR2_BACMT|nr:UPF0236 family protein [Bacillus methanolicus]EIJ78333.1 transposase [Bacillus methanolicus PB1]